MRQPAIEVARCLSTTKIDPAGQGLFPRRARTSDRSGYHWQRSRVRSLPIAGWASAGNHVRSYFLLIVVCVVSVISFPVGARKQTA